MVMVLGWVAACGGDGGAGVTGETTEVATTGALEPSTGSSGGSTGVTPTTGEVATTGGSESETESGSGTESSGGTTLDSTGPVEDTSTGESTGSSTGGESTGESTGGESTGSSTGGESTGGEDVVSFAACEDGMAASCPAQDAACLMVDGPGGFWPEGSFFVQWSYCTRECESDAECVSGLEGGSAKTRCLAKGGNDVKVCVLDCSFGKKCPDSLECANDDTCGTRFCDCEGTGCQDKLCTG